MVGSNEVLGGGGFHHVAMRVKDFDASVRFYTEVLGFTKAIGWGDGDKRAIMLDAGDGGCLELFAGGAVHAGDGAVLHFALNCQDVDATVERIRASGAEITTEPKDVEIPSEPPAAVRLAFFRGPDGELVELFRRKS